MAFFRMNNLLKIAALYIYWPFSCYRAAIWKIRNYVFFLHRSRPPTHYSWSSVASDDDEGGAGGTRDTIVVVPDFCGSLLRPTSNPFPYLMVVAFEGGGLLRALLLLLSYPLLLCAIGSQHELISIKVMVFITFCGLKVKDVELVARAVLPKFYLDNLHPSAYHELLVAAAGGSSSGRVVVLSSSLPGVMVAGFLKDYLGVDHAEVVGMELQVIETPKGGSYFTGLLLSSAGSTHHHVGSTSYNKHVDHLPHCKEVDNIVSSQEEMSTLSTRGDMKYPIKPLIFHDSRLAFLPTPLSTLALFLFLPLLVPLSVARIFLGIVPPYKLIFPLAALTGTRFRVHGHDQTCSSTLILSAKNGNGNGKGNKGVVYVCNHRTLLDPVMLATALQRPIPAVTYSVSPLSEAIAPMRTVRLTRNRETDAKTMAKLLEEGDLTLCPEGTTCREPYLLRFSPLFAEVAEKIVPVAMEAHGSWFYGTTASGLKSLDPLIFFMNPTPGYRVRVLEQLPEELSCAGGGWSGSEVANRVQKQLGDALGFECTSFTRKDKYMMLAGNEGVVISNACMQDPASLNIIN